MPIKYVPYSHLKRPFCTPRCHSNLHASISINKTVNQKSKNIATSHLPGPILGLEATPQLSTSYRRPSTYIREKRNIKKFNSFKPNTKPAYSSVDYSAVMSEQIKKLIYISKKKETGTLLKDNKTIVNIDIRFSFKPKFTQSHLMPNIESDSPNRLIIRGTSPFKDRKEIMPALNRPHTTNGTRSLRVII